MNDIVTILMAAYNGEKYIRRQLDSLLKQTYSQWRLFIRDDVSKDTTPAIIKEYSVRFPDKIFVVDNNGQNKGSLLNFAELLKIAEGAAYIMFCDQDDEWIADKIALTMSVMKTAEQDHGKQYPILVYTNFQYVDEDTNIIPSKKDFNINRLSPFGFAQLLAQNPVYGCTSMLNRALADKIGVIPSEGYFHDYWIALAASALGKLIYLNNKTVLYRQHASNVSGNFDNDSLSKRFRRIVVNKKHIAETKARYQMLLCFKTKYGNELAQKESRILNEFLCFINQKNPACLLNSIRNGVRSQTLPQTFLMYTTALFTKVSSGSRR